MMLPGKKTTKTLACIFAGANVLGTRKKDNRPVLIYIYIDTINPLPHSIVEALPPGGK